jgi:hypothetical protein
MDHVVYVDAKAKEMDALLKAEKTMIIRGAAGRKMPYGRVEGGDILYFINNNAEGVVKARAKVSSVINTEKMTQEESISLVESHQAQLQLTARQFKRWAGKRYLVLIAVKDVEPVRPFPIDKSDYGSMDDWLRVEKIDNVRIKHPSER